MINLLIETVMIYCFVGLVYSLVKNSLVTIDLLWTAVSWPYALYTWIKGFWS